MEPQRIHGTTDSVKKRARQGWLARLRGVLQDLQIILLGALAALFLTDSLNVSTDDEVESAED